MPPAPSWDPDARLTEAEVDIHRLLTDVLPRLAASHQRALAAPQLLALHQCEHAFTELVGDLGQLTQDDRRWPQGRQRLAGFVLLLDELRTELQRLVTGEAPRLN